MNALKTGILMFIMTAIFMAIGSMFGPHGVIIALLLAVGMNFFAYWYSDKVVLSMYRAKELSPADDPRLFGIVERLAKKADLPMPKIYFIPSPSPNAFATGRNPEHAAVAVTEGLYRLLGDRELEAVLAHELAHVKHRDILTGSIVGTMAGAISMLASMAKWGAILGGFGGRDNDDAGGIFGLLAMAIIAPIAALLIQMAISRSREYAADKAAGEYTGDPIALANALQKIHAGVERIPMREAKESTAHMMIANPLSGRAFATLFSTHPRMEDRVKRLEAQAAEMGKSYYNL